MGSKRQVFLEAMFIVFISDIVVGSKCVNFVVAVTSKLLFIVQISPKADINYPRGIGTQSVTVSSLWGECSAFSAAEAIHIIKKIFVSLGTHYCWVDIDCVDSTLAQSFYT